MFLARRGAQLLHCSDFPGSEQKRMPAFNKPLLFLSSTSDLQDERSAVENALPASVEAYRYERETARRESPKKRLERVLRRTDVFVAILGRRYGSLYPGDEKERSIVEWEFDTAYENEATEIFTLSRVYEDPDEIDERQRTFIERLGAFDSGVWLKPFETISQLEREFSKALIDWLTRFYDRSYETAGESSGADDRSHSSLRRVAVGTLSVTLVGVAGALYANLLSTNAVVLLCMLLAVLIVACMLVVDQ